MIATQPASSPSRQCMMCTWKLRTASFHAITAKHLQTRAPLVTVVWTTSGALHEHCQPPRHHRTALTDAYLS